MRMKIATLKVNNVGQAVWTGNDEIFFFDGASDKTAHQPDDLVGELAA